MRLMLPIFHIFLGNSQCWGRTEPFKESWRVTGQQSVCLSEETLDIVGMNQPGELHNLNLIGSHYHH